MSTPESNSESVAFDDVAKRLLGPQSHRSSKPVVFDMERAAKGQIESAIMLWFLEGDIGAIFTLARAAQELVHNAGRKVGKPSQGMEMEASWATEVRAVYKVPQNFLKHGPDRNNPEPQIDLEADAVEAFLFDAAASYVNLYHKATALMRLFASKLALEQPGFLSPGHSAGFFLYGADVDSIKHLSRTEFLVEAISCLGEHIQKTGKAKGK